MIKRMDEFIQPSFVPLDDDILRVRVKTTGIMELTYTIEHTSFTYDIKVRRWWREDLKKGNV